MGNLVQMSWDDLQMLARGVEFRVTDIVDGVAMVEPIGDDYKATVGAVNDDLLTSANSGYMGAPAPELIDDTDWELQEILDVDGGGKGYVMSPKGDDVDWESKVGMSYDEATILSRRVMARGDDSGVVFELLAVRKLVMDALSIADPHTVDHEERYEGIEESLRELDKWLGIGDEDRASPVPTVAHPHRDWIEEHKQFVHGNAKVEEDGFHHIPKTSANDVTLCGKDIWIVSRGIHNATCPECREVYHALHSVQGDDDDK